MTPQAKYRATPLSKKVGVPDFTRSDYTSFYATNKIKQLNVGDELKQAKSKGLFADLQGARVYVTGAGLVTDAVKHAYRSGKTMDALGDFWSQYFEHSHATLVNFGAPSLSTDLQ